MTNLEKLTSLEKEGKIRMERVTRIVTLPGSMIVEPVADVYAATDPIEDEWLCGVYMPRKGAWLGRYYIPQPEGGK